MLSRIKSDDRIHGTGDIPALRETRRVVNRSIRAFLFCQPFGQNAGGLSSFDQPLIGRRIAQHQGAKPLLPFEQAQEAFDAGEIGVRDQMPHQVDPSRPEPVVLRAQQFGKILKLGSERGDLRMKGHGPSLKHHAQKWEPILRKTMRHQKNRAISGR